MSSITTASSEAPTAHGRVLQHFDHLSDSSLIRLPVLRAMLSVSSGTIWRMCRRGELKPVKVAERVTAWRVGDVRKYLARAQGEAAADQLTAPAPGVY